MVTDQAPGLEERADGGRRQTLAQKRAPPVIKMNLVFMMQYRAWRATQSRRCWVASIPDVMVSSSVSSSSASSSSTLPRENIDLSLLLNWARVRASRLQPFAPTKVRACRWPGQSPAWRWIS